MDSNIEKKIEKEVGKEVAKEVAREVKKEVNERVEKEVDKKVEKVEKKLEKEFDKKVEKEVNKRLSSVVYEKTRRSASLFGSEFKKQTATAITAAFAFLIALSWRTPIQNLIDKIIEHLGLKGSAIYIEFLSAMIITLIAVLVLMWFSKNKES